MLHIVLLVTGCLAAFHVNAEKVGLSDDGREVRLAEDGTWEYVSDDRYATLPDGQRVLLKSDGTWENAEDDAAWVAVHKEGRALTLCAGSSLNLPHEQHPVFYLPAGPLKSYWYVYPSTQLTA